jgi:hypothetical protein
MTSVYGPAASHERRVKGLEQPGEDIARLRRRRAERPLGEPSGGLKNGSGMPILVCAASLALEGAEPIRLAVGDQGGAQALRGRAAHRRELRGTATGGILQYDNLCSPRGLNS